MKSLSKCLLRVLTLNKSAILPLVTLLLLLPNQGLWASNRLIESAKKDFEQNRYVQAHEKLNKISFDEIDPKKMALVELFRGLIFFNQNNYKFAVDHFNKSIQLGTRLSDVAFYHLGLSYNKLGDSQRALKAFKKVEQTEASDFLIHKSEFNQAEILNDKGENKKALGLYKKLERKMRRSEVYPDILWSLVKINNSKNKKQNACYWARKLYRKFPIYEPIAHWGLDWQNNLVDGGSLPCENSLSDQLDRIKRLQWMGAGEKAFSELKQFQKSKEEPFVKDMAMAEYLINEGIVREAFNTLKPYYGDEEKKKDFDFVSLFAKSASRAGEHQTAIGVYVRASKDFKGRDGRKALYRAAFLAYQFQDYDGAIRSFKKLIKNSPRSSQAKQANWYLPWIYYLKGHYQKSYNLFKSALQNKRRKLPRYMSDSKIKYWMAMCMKKLGNIEVAKDLFLDVSKDEAIGYYSIASVHRLRSIVGDKGMANIKHKDATILHENWMPLFTKNSVKDDQVNRDQTRVKTNKNYHSEWDKLPYMKEYLDMRKPSRILTSISAPEFRKRIERADDMAKVGMMELAKWELYSVEGRTKDREHLKTLMYTYFRNNIYHRSAYIGTQHFYEDRKHLGLPIGKALWQYVYPRAFESNVLASGKKFAVPPEFVWSIMKAETNFRPDAMSPVGARGLMQVMTHTGRKVASLIGKKIEGEDLLKPQVSVEIGTRYLKRNLKKFNEKVALAAAAYNGGPHRVHGWLHQFGHLEMDEFIEHIPFLETRNYVKKVTRYFTLYNLIYNDNANASSWLAEAVNVFPEGAPPTKETWEVL